MELQSLYDAHGHFIAGQWQTGNGNKAESQDPATEVALGRYRDADTAQVTAAIDAAYAARGAMRALSAWQRSALLRRTAGLVQDRAESLGRLVALETGKPIRQAVGEAVASAESLDWFADEARRLFGLNYESRTSGDRYLVQ